MTSLGTGLELDEYNDLVVGGTGDTTSVEGLDEVAKDASFIIQKVAYSWQVGSVLKPNRQTKMESRIETALTDDDRIIDAEVVARGDPDEDTIIISVLVITNEGLIEQTIPL